MKNKKGFIRIVEAFIMIMIITGVLLIFVNKEDAGNYDDSSGIAQTEQEALEKLRSNLTIRSDILNLGILPVEWADLPNSIKSGVQSLTLSDFECQAKVCSLTDSCILSNSVSKDVSAQRTIIAADLNNYKPRQLKLFCWKK